MNKTLNYFAGMMREAIEADKDKMELYRQIDVHRTGAWQTPQALKNLPWIKNRKFSSTKPADAMDSGARTFASLFPKIGILPLSDDPQEYSRVERLETALDWQFRRMNMGDGKTTHWKILESAMRYCAVAMQTEYLPHTMKDQQETPLLKELLRQSKFLWTVHHPSSVHSRRSRGVLTMALLATVKSGAEIVEEFGEDNEGVAQMLEQMKKNGKVDYEQLLKSRFSFYDLTTWDERVIVIKNNNGSLDVQQDPAGGIKLRMDEHKLPFIPWVIADNEDPILKNAINTGLLDNLNILRTIEFSKAIASAAESKMSIETPDGTLNGVNIDNKNPLQPISHQPGTKIQELRGIPIDPQLANMRQMAESELTASSVTQVLSDAAALDSRNFSTANIKYKTAVAQLALARNAAARAEELGFYQMFQWIDFAKDKPLVTFRDKAKTFQGAELSAGEEIAITADDFDLEHLYISVTLREDSLLDKQSEWNIGVTQVDRFGMSRQIVAEELGVENYGLHEQKRAAEELVLATVQAEAQRILGQAQAEVQQMMAQVQMQVQQAQMQMQMDAQAQPQQQQPQTAVQDQNAGGSFASLQGADMRGGGLPAAGVAPGENRVQINGQTDTGEQLA